MPARSARHLSSPRVAIIPARCAEGHDLQMADPSRLPKSTRDNIPCPVKVGFRKKCGSPVKPI